MKASQACEGAPGYVIGHGGPSEVRAIQEQIRVRMPDTWIPEFDLSDSAGVKAINDAEPAGVRGLHLFEGTRAGLRKN